MSPQKPLGRCNAPGCPARTATGYCHDHMHLAQRRSPRPTAEARGYGARWAAVSARFLKVNPDCHVCGGPATITDHIEPVTGPEDPRFWWWINWQPLCSLCHGRKTVRDNTRPRPPAPVLPNRHARTIREALEG